MIGETGPLETLADDLEALCAWLDQLWAAQSVCQAVMFHRDTPPKIAADSFVLGRWIGDYEATR